MWTGVERGLAGIKFSVSPRSRGAIRQSKSKLEIIREAPSKSLIV